MSNEYVFLAKKIANDLLNIEFRGVGDTIEAAAYRVETKWHVPSSVLMRLRHRSDIKDMKVSNWFAVFEAYQNACKQAEQKYQIARNTNEIDPRLASLADFIAGYQGSKKNEKDNPQ